LQAILCSDFSPVFSGDCHKMRICLLEYGIAAFHGSITPGKVS
jgi:hypothetical protein